MYHLYDGGGVTASGPAVLIRKSLFNSVSLSGFLLPGHGQQCLIDVVTNRQSFSRENARKAHWAWTMSTRLADSACRAQPATSPITQRRARA